MKGNLFIGCLKYIAIVIFFSECTFAAGPRIKPTKIECKSLDENFCHIRHAYLKPKGEFSPAFLHVDLKVHDVKNFTYHVQFFQKNPLNGQYFPILVNLTGDLCHTLDNLENNKMMKTLYDSIITGTNVNHKCPFNHDIIFENYIIKEDILKSIPTPPGDYKIQVKFAAYNDWKIKCTTYTTVVPKLF